MCPGGTKSCTEAGSSHTSSTSHARKTLLIPSSGSNYQRPVHRVFCYYPDRLLEMMGAVGAALGYVDILLCARARDPPSRIDNPEEIERTYPRQARAPFNVTGHPALAMMGGLSSGGLP